jgi:fatty acid desaturase
MRAPAGFRLLPELDPARAMGIGPTSHPEADERSLRHNARGSMRARRGITGIAAVAAMLNVVCSLLAWHVGGIAWWQHALVVVPTLYFMCICIHDGCHFMLTPWRALTDAVGFLLSLFLFIPFPLLRASHLAHHHHFGTDRDPESVVYGARWWQLPVRLLRVPAFYFRAWSELRAGQRLVCVLHLCVCVGVVAALGVDVIAGVVVPALLTIAWFGATTVYAPHAETAPRWMPWLTGHSGYHYEHHRNVAVPYNQYWELRWRDLQVGLSEENWRGETRVLGLLNAPLSQLLRGTSATSSSSSPASSSSGLPC